MEEKFKDDVFCENCFEEVPVEEVKKMRILAGKKVCENCFEYGV